MKTSQQKHQQIVSTKQGGSTNETVDTDIKLDLFL
jgi:hypothetical protein